MADRGFRFAESHCFLVRPAGGVQLATTSLQIAEDAQRLAYLRAPARPQLRDGLRGDAGPVAPIAGAPVHGRLIRAVDREVAARAVAACVRKCGVDPDARALMLARRFQRADAGMK